MANNYFSLHGAVSKDGKPIDFTNTPLREDINCQNIVWVKLTKILNIQGTLVDAFQLMINNETGLTYSDVYLYTYTGFTTIANFAQSLATLGTQVTFTTYTNLLSRDYKAVTVTGQSMLLNDLHLAPWGRRYVPQTNSTFVKCAVNTKLSKVIWQFSGNQTIAGNYTYAYL